jgi:CubicO group peptidase (beta-lactamase class C family)
MTKIAFLSIAVGLLVFTDLRGRCTAAVADDETLRPSIDQLVRPYLDSETVVGMTIGVLRDGKPEVFGYGRMSRDDSRVPDGDTIYEIGSVSKILTGTLLADAVVQGQVKLDQPAGDLLPAGVEMPARGDRAITLQDLSTHVSGLPRLPNNMKVGDHNNPYADYLAEDLYTFLNHHELTRDPGTVYEYSNLAQGLLGHLLSLRAKTTYEDLLCSGIAVPLKMTSTTITIEKQSQSRLAPGHAADGQPAANWDLPVLAGAGGIRSTVNDLLLLAAANLAPPQNKLGEAIEMAWTVHQKPIREGDPSLGLGWHVTPDGTRWHNGQTGGYHAMIRIDRKTNSSVILLTNSATSEVDSLASDILRMISGEKVAPRKLEKGSNPLTKLLQDHLAAAAKQRSPFAAVRWRESEPEVKVGDEWFQLVSLDGIPASEILAFSRRTYHELWQMRFEEDLVDVLNGMGHEPKDNVQLVVMPLDSATTRTLENVPMTRANRQAIKAAALPAAMRRIMAGVQAGARSEQEQPARGAVPGDVPAEALEKFVGSYQLDTGVLVTVESVDGKLMIGLAEHPSQQAFARSETVWFYTGVDATFTFNVDQDGKCDSLVLSQKQTAKRKE